MPVLKTYKNGVWEPVSGMSEHTHTKNDITDLQEKVYTQPDEPVDAPIGAVWVDTDEDVGFGGSSGDGSASIDVTASVGQTIVVEEVDANGKPTKWKAADFQEKICGIEMGYIYPERTLTLEEGEQEIDFVLIEGEQYIVNWNGVDYNCEAKLYEVEGKRAIYLGNGALLGLPVASSEPFLIVTTKFEGLNFCLFVPADESTESFTVSIKGEVVTPIPVEYMGNAFPYYIEVTGSGTDEDPYVCNDTVANVNAIYNSGRSIVMRHTGIDATSDMRFTSLYHMLGEYSVPLGDEYVRFFAFTNFTQQGGVTVNAILTIMYLTPTADGTYVVTENYPALE